jgi:hypothetical protein
MSINGGLLRGDPVVSESPSIEFPYTLTASQRLLTKKEGNKKDWKNINPQYELSYTIKDLADSFSR